ncbi:ferritin-like domain-containing protein [Litorimonas sp. WD9-15]|uniref:ferritin-like domain-containing protein n=1 Tax=Litorimonas sp. WD9-15 TaxID=3418716 RepID=UPI003D01D9B2
MTQVVQLEDASKLASREQLMGMLQEAAEVEHNLMLTYLYAAFSIKTEESEGLTAEQGKTLKTWRRSVIRIAVEEMGHLALVCNLLCAIGGTPHFGRLNFPIAPGPLPAKMSVRLRRFDQDTLQHFIYLERPECAQDIEDSPPFRDLYDYHRAPIEQSRLMPVAMDYPTVGALYDQIVETFEVLCEKYGEDHLFVGDASRQIGPDITPLPGLCVINNLRDAKVAVDVIKEQGEGANAHSETSHFKRFCRIQAQYDAYLDEDPTFDPARPVAENPVMRSPPTPEGKVWVTEPTAATLMDWTNALYIKMLRLLSQAFGRRGDAHEKRILVNAATDLMYAMTPAAEAMTHIQANGDTDRTAGMSFATIRNSVAPLPIGTEWRVFACRFNEITEAGEDIRGISDAVDASIDMVARIAETFIREAEAIIEAKGEDTES